MGIRLDLLKIILLVAGGVIIGFVISGRGSTTATQAPKEASAESSETPKGGEEYPPELTAVEKVLLRGILENDVRNFVDHKPSLFFTDVVVATDIDLYQAYRVNAIAADEHFKHAPVAISGTFAGAETDVVDGFRIRLRMVNAGISKANASFLKNVTLGSSITMICRIRGFSVYAVDAADCMSMQTYLSGTVAAEVADIEYEVDEIRPLSTPESIALMMALLVESKMPAGSPCLAKWEPSCGTNMRALLDSVRPEDREGVIVGATTRGIRLDAAAMRAMRGADIGAKRG